MYTNATTDGANAALRARPGAALQDVAPAAGTGDTTAPVGVVVPAAMKEDPDAAPASAPPKSKTPPPPTQEQLKPDGAESVDTSGAVAGGETGLLDGDAVGKHAGS
jgi:hypothetical protein